MKNFDKITELLDKRELKSEERSLLNELLAGDEESRRYYDFYLKLAQIVKSSSHIEEEDLAEYIFFKNDFGTENFRGAVIPKIEDHLRRCSKCRENFKMLNEEYSELDNFLSGNKMDDSPRLQSRPALFKPKFVYTFLGAGALIFLLLLTISALSTPFYYSYAGLKDQSELYVTRGRGTSYFQQSIQALQENNYEKAAEYLKKDIYENPGDETIFYSYYVAGLSEMKAAEKNFVGMFTSYDKSKAAEALKYFKITIEKNTSGKYPNITFNSFFYSGKAYLMLDDLPHAREYFNKVISGKGSKMNEAKKILSELE